ncbi:MAG: type I DNA topoisomerase [bacterium]|nr:type I DNA topoisomerase [bacterium]
MAKSLVIVESPTKQKTLSKYLGSDYLIRATMGHVIDLPTRKLGVDVTRGFKPQYVIIPSRKKVLAEIQKVAKQVDRIYIATDPDREGEAIGWHIANYINNSKSDSRFHGNNTISTKSGTAAAKSSSEIHPVSPTIYRVLFNEITRAAVLTALEHPGTIDQNKVDAQQARRILDRLVGYQLSPLLWKKVRKGLSAGRVQSVAVRLICEREQAIVQFVPQEYWSITAHLLAENIPFTARLIRYNNQKLIIKNKTEAERIVADLSDAEYRVSRITIRLQQKTPPLPFTTSKLQQEAVRKLSFSTNKTMQIAQSLYEGVSLGKEGVAGLITYMRTDSTRVALEAQEQARNYITTKYGPQYIPEVPRSYVAKGNVQDAHEAIRPTNVTWEPDSVKPYLTVDQYKLYKLIWERFVASQMSSAQYEITSVDIAAKQYTFRATGTVIKFPGFTRIYTEGQDDTPVPTIPDGSTDTTELELNEPQHQLPRVKENQILTLTRLEPNQHFTEPPPRYSEATLVKELEEQGIGRPSTYATIIKTIQDRHYVQKLKGRFHPTQLGIVVNALLVLHFPKIMDVSFTAQMESELDKIEEGEMQWQAVLNDFYNPFRAALAEAQKNMRNVKQELSTPTGEYCEKCGAEMVIKWSKTGSFMACSAFPKCKNAKPIIAPKPVDSAVGSESKNQVVGVEQRHNATCEKCGADMVIRNGKYGQFLACSKYPKCKTTKPIPLGPCPEPGCNGHIASKRTRKGKIFYACSKYPECQFATWDKPMFRSCPECGAAYLVEKFSKTEGNYFSCEKCKYKEIQKGPTSSE